MLNTNSDLISQNRKKSAAAKSRGGSSGSTESLKESLPKISQLSKNHNVEPGNSALTKRLTESKMTNGSDKKPLIVRRMGE